MRVNGHHQVQAFQDNDKNRKRRKYKCANKRNGL